MIARMNSTDLFGRDPVALAIEALLFEMQSKGMGSISKTSTQNSVVVTFGDIRAEGNTADIALVRLAQGMMDDSNYTQLLMEALKAPMKFEAA